MCHQDEHQRASYQIFCEVKLLDENIAGLGVPRKDKIAPRTHQNDLSHQYVVMQNYTHGLE